MEETESEGASVRTDTSQSGKSRLVIRVKITPEIPPQATKPKRVNKRALALALSVIGIVTLMWIGIGVFRSGPSPTPAVNEHSTEVDSEPSPLVLMPNDTARVGADPSPDPALPTSETQLANAVPDERTSTEATVASKVQQQPHSSPSPIQEVLPNVPQSALQTIRGTIRVAIRVTIDQEGAVLEASTAVPGPSRYFERLSLEAAEKWAFTPAVQEEERTMLLSFHYTREGATARAYPGSMIQ